MGVTPEGRVKAQVKKLLKEFGVYWHCPVQNGMGEPTLDFICCHRGYFVAIETKKPGGKPTVRQQITMSDMQQAGAFVFVISDDESLGILRAYLELMS